MPENKKIQEMSEICEKNAKIIPEIAKRMRKDAQK